MRKSNKTLFEKILIIIMLLIVSPFILSGLAFFLIVYIIIFIFESPFYFNSKYYKEIKEKYYSFITFSKSFNTYQKYRKITTLTIMNNYEALVNDETIVYLIKENCITNDKLIDFNSLIITNKSCYFLINIKNLSREDYEQIKNYNLITYKD